ncbi:MAG: hypothetical protein H6931_08190 [Burkholderiaceae bacterium]|nr:hypothetical protein [Burkholderiaceae bacterium]
MLAVMTEPMVTTTPLSTITRTGMGRARTSTPGMRSSTEFEPLLDPSDAFDDLVNLNLVPRVGLVACRDFSLDIDHRRLERRHPGA